jgi:hypothetical protein
VVAIRPSGLCAVRGLIVPQPQSAHGKLGNEDASTDSCESDCQFAGLRLIASPTGIARLPEFMMHQKDFHERGSGQYRWRSAGPYHVA